MSALALGGFLALAPAASAWAAAYENGACVINRLSEGPVAGGSQCPSEDLSGEKLGQAALQGANVRDADFTRADLQAASLTGATIEGADFTDAKVNGADFTGAGIVPELVEKEADSAAGAAVTFAPTLPAGLTFSGCAIAGEPVEDGAVFPVGESGVVCALTTSQQGSALAVVRITVSQATAAPEEPLFTDEPASHVRTNESEISWVWYAAGGGLLLVGIAAFVVSQVVARRRS